MELPTLAVTGSTGALGGQVARLLADAGLALRLPVRSLGRAPRLAGSVPVPFSYADSRAARDALSGVDTLFMVSAAEAPDRLDQHRAFVDAAAGAGVRHIVYTSFLGAAPDSTFTLARDHWATEQHIVARGLRHTFLRDNFYADLWPGFVGNDDVLRGPGGQGRVSVVARSDVARVAATVLQTPAEHEGATYDLTGPEALTLTEIAVVLSEHLGRPVTYRDETVEEAYTSRRQWAVEDWQYDAWVSTYTAIRAGELERVSDDVQRVTGRRAMTLQELLPLV